MKNSPLYGFFQSSHWRDFQISLGKKVFSAGIFEKEKLVGFGNFIEQVQSKINLKFFYAPRGPILSEEILTSSIYTEIIEKFWNEVKILARREKISFIRVEPSFVLESENSSIGKFYEKIGFKKSFKFQVQPLSTSVINLLKSEDEILSAMKQKTRYNVNLARKKGVEVFVNFKNQDFKNKGEFIRKKLNDLETSISTLSDFQSVTPQGENFKNSLQTYLSLQKQTTERDKISMYQDSYFENLLKIFPEVFVIEGVFEEKVLVSNICLKFGKTFIYLYGASSNENRNVMAPFLVQWESMKFAKSLGCNFYDFGGLDRFGDLPHWEGITKFKRGFSGKEVSFMHPMDFVINKFLYEGLKIYSKLVK